MYIKHVYYKKQNNLLCYQSLKCPSASNGSNENTVISDGFTFHNFRALISFICRYIVANWFSTQQQFLPYSVLCTILYYSNHRTNIHNEHLLMYTNVNFDELRTRRSIVCKLQESVFSYLAILIVLANSRYKCKTIFYITANRFLLY